MPDLEVQIEVIGTTAVLRVSGAADIASAPALAVRAAEIIRSGDRDIVVDLTGVTFADSTALSVLLNITRRATRAGLGCAVVCPEGPVRTPIRIARLEETLRVADTESEALRAVGEVRRRASGDTP